MVDSQVQVIDFFEVLVGCFVVGMFFRSGNYLVILVLGSNEFIWSIVYVVLEVNFINVDIL